MGYKPSGSALKVNPSGLTHVTGSDVQTAIAQLDSALSTAGGKTSVYSASTQYNVGDLSSYGGQMWLSNALQTGVTPATSQTAPAIVQQSNAPTGNSNAGAVSVTFASAPSANNTVICLVANATGTGAPTMPSGWTLLASETASGSTTNQAVWAYQAPAGFTATSFSVTLATAGGVVAFELAGKAQLDGYGVGTLNTNGSAWNFPVSATTHGPVTAFLFDADGSGHSEVTPSGWTSKFQPGWSNTWSETTASAGTITASVSATSSGNGWGMAALMVCMAVPGAWSALTTIAASGLTNTTTGMTHVTHTNVQSALADLDAAIPSLSSIVTDWAAANSYASGALVENTGALYKATAAVAANSAAPVPPWTPSQPTIVQHGTPAGNSNGLQVTLTLPSAATASNTVVIVYRSSQPSPPSTPPSGFTLAHSWSAAGYGAVYIYTATGQTATSYLLTPQSADNESDIFEIYGTPSVVASADNNGSGTAISLAPSYTGPALVIAGLVDAGTTVGISGATWTLEDNQTMGSHQFWTYIDSNVSGAVASFSATLNTSVAWFASGVVLAYPASNWEYLAGVPGGGTKGQALVKNSGANQDMSWTSLVAQDSFTGTAPLSALTTGNGLTGVGQNVLAANTTGIQNTAVGYHALTANTTGGHNTAVGSGALAALNTGNDYNVAVGTNALNSCNGASNTAVGGNANHALAAVSYTTAIGYNTVASVAGAIAIGVDSAGTAASSATQDLAVIGTTLTTLQIAKLKVTTAGPDTPIAQTAAYTAHHDDFVLANAATAAFTVTLPAVVAGARVTVKKTDSSANAVTVAPATGTIDGAASVTLTSQYQSHTYVCDGTNWWVA